MARATTDKYEVEVKFNDVTSKIRHMLRNTYWINEPGAKRIVTGTHDRSEDLKDVFTVTRDFKDAKDKFEEYFHKGSHTKSFTVKLLGSTQLADRFAIEVVYAGGEKPWEGVFNATFQKATAEFTALRSSTKTKNLGVKHKRKSGDDIKIIQDFVEEALATTKLKKSSTVPKPTDNGKYKTTVLSPSKYFYTDDTHSIVCVHLARFKIGIIPLKNDMSKVRILVHFLSPNGKYCNPYLGIKDVEVFNSLEIVNAHDRIQRIKEFSARGDIWQRLPTIKKDLYDKNHENIPTFLLSDPNFFDQLAAFFTEVESRTVSSTVLCAP